VDQSTWSEMKSYLESNPAIAKGLQNFSKNPEAMRGWLQTQALAEHYQKQLDGPDQVAKFKERMAALQSDEEVRVVFDEIQKHGLKGSMKFWSDEALLLKINEKMGGVPVELQPILNKISDTPLSLSEAAANGDMKAVTEYLKKSQSVDAPDSKGITALGHAIGANRVAVVKFLLESRADAHSVDAKGNTGMHYAAGYGRKELLEYLLRVEGVSADRANLEGQTPLRLAELNKHKACVDLLLS
ncbi:unnamed protein product, partial [Polarella glacialis]